MDNGGISKTAISQVFPIGLLAKIDSFGQRNLGSDMDNIFKRGMISCSSIMEVVLIHYLRN